MIEVTVMIDFVPSESLHGILSIVLGIMFGWILDNLLGAVLNRILGKILDNMLGVVLDTMLGAVFNSFLGMVLDSMSKGVMESVLDTMLSSRIGKQHNCLLFTPSKYKKWHTWWLEYQRRILILCTLV